MEVRDWIMILSAAIVVVGWYVASWRARKNEIAKERRIYRLEMLHSFYPIVHYINEAVEKTGGKAKPDIAAEKLSELLRVARTKFLLYGYDDEICAYENLIKAFRASDSIEKIQCANVVSDMVRKRIREELDLPAHDL